MKLLSSLNINRIAIAAGVVVVLLYLLAYSGSDMQLKSVNNAALISQPDFYLVNNISTQFDEQGMLELLASNQRTLHNPANRSIDITNPVFQFYSDGEYQWRVSAKTGVLFQESDRVELTKEVIVLSSDRSTSLKTPALTLFPSKKQAQTDQPITLVNINGVTRAIGMKTDLETKDIELLNRVRGQYEPMVSTSHVD